VKSNGIPAKCNEIPTGKPKFQNFEFETTFRSKLPENREISAGIPFPVVTEIFFQNENVNPATEYQPAAVHHGPRSGALLAS